MNKWLVFIIIILLFTSCEISTELIDFSDKAPEIEYSVQICYAISSENHEEDDSGLYIYNSEQDVSIKPIISQAINNLSQVTESGLYTFIENGKPFLGEINKSALEISMPTSTDSNKEYFFYSPFLTISPDGKKLIFVSAYDNKGSHSDTSSKFYLIIQDIESYKRDIIPFSDFFGDLAENTPGAHAILTGDCLITDYYGDNIYFVVQTFLYEDKKYFISSRIGSYNKGFKQVSTASRISDINLVGINHYTERLFIEYHDDIYKYEGLDFVYTNIPYSYLNNQFQFTYFTNELAIWNENGISIINPETKDLIVDLIHYDEIDSLFGAYDHEPNKSLAFSPDRSFIAFSLKNTSTNLYDLFLVSKAGSVISLIGEGLPLGTISLYSKAKP